jgi:hypothetical protein
MISCTPITSSAPSSMLHYYAIVIISFTFHPKLDFLSLPARCGLLITFFLMQFLMYWQSRNWWCKSVSTFYRSQTFLTLPIFSCRCNLENLVLEMDRILRPEGWAIFRDKVETLSTVQETLRSLHWEVRLSYEQQNEQLLVAQKTFWRPKTTSWKQNWFTLWYKLIIENTIWRGRSWDVFI